MVRIRRFLPHSIFGRTLLIVLAPLVILQVVLAIVFYERHWENVSRWLTGSVAGDISTLIWIMDRGEDADRERVMTEIGRDRFGLTVQFRPDAVLEGAAPVARNNRVERLLGSAMAGLVERPFVIDARTFDDHIIVRVQLSDGVLDVRVPRKRLDNRTTDIFVFWMIGTSVILALIAAYFVRQQIRPMRRLAAAAEKFGRGIVDVEFRPSGADEVRQAAHAFVAMRERIRRQIEQRTLMLAGVSHDLRTPLTRMQLELALMEDGDGVANLKDDIRDMEHMIEVYLAFAQGEGEERSRSLDLAPVIHQVAADAAGEVTVSTAGDLALTGRANALKRCLTNLVDNACRHGTQVVVAAERTGAGIAVTIDDNGPGIPGSRREEAFQPFVRLDKSRDPNLGGGGLGLTIARDVVHSHGGEITLSESPSGGLRVGIALPG